MATDIKDVKIFNNEKGSRFEMELNGNFAEIPYRLKDDFIALFHTEVPEEFRGKGLGTKLALYALNYAKEHQLKILLYCPFIAKYVQEHPEWKPFIKRFLVSQK